MRDTCESELVDSIAAFEEMVHSSSFFRWSWAFSELVSTQSGTRLETMADGVNQRLRYLIASGILTELQKYIKFSDNY